VSPPPHVSLVVLAASFVLALALPAFGFVRLLARAKALRVRIEAYAALPIVAQLDRASRKIDVGAAAVARAPALIARARAAGRETVDAFAKIRRILASPASLWRLSARILTGE